jgi:hypothetical protein
LFTVAGQPPPVGVLHMAMVHGAMYDAVNTIDGQYEPYLYSLRTPMFWASKDAAVVAAAYTVLNHLLPAQAAQLRQLYEASLAALPNNSAKWFGVSIGGWAGRAMIVARGGDGRFGAPGFPTGTLPGQWRPVLPAFVNDPNAWVKDVRPFLLESPTQFRSAPPFPLASPEYAAEFNQVKSVGSATSATRTMFQTNSSLYWAESPVRTWNRIMRTISAQEGLTLEENARLFAMANMVVADSAITVWNDKVFYGFWRPITAIREAGSDGNAATVADPSWVPLIANPPYPEHTSGASGVAGGFTRAIEHVLGTDHVAWSDTNLGGQTRSFTRLSDARQEVVDARVWSGIHFLRADVLGALVGTNVADWANAHFFQPAG